MPRTRNTGAFKRRGNSVSTPASEAMATARSPPATQAAGIPAMKARKPPAALMARVAAIRVTSWRERRQPNAASAAEPGAEPPGRLAEILRLAQKAEPHEGPAACAKRTSRSDADICLV